MTEESPIRRGINWLDGVFAVGGGIVLGLFAWSNRPVGMRDIQSTFTTIVQGKDFLSEGAFYGSMFIAVVLVIYGSGRLTRKNKE
tara:strand:+ start:269 stop:523 length:255 start_codon:yes stop_codon:yes gene_type:complete